MIKEEDLLLLMNLSVGIFCLGIGFSGDNLWCNINLVVAGVNLAYALNNLVSRL